jgi:hypothetical protein
MLQEQQSPSSSAYHFFFSSYFAYISVNPMYGIHHDPKSNSLCVCVYLCVRLRVYTTTHQSCVRALYDVHKMTKLPNEAFLSLDLIIKQYLTAFNHT